MHTTKLLLPIEQEIDAALSMNLTSLREAFFDLLAAIILFFIAVISILHAILCVSPGEKPALLPQYFRFRLLRFRFKVFLFESVRKLAGECMAERWNLQ